jgi:hypothetical protein
LYQVGIKYSIIILCIVPTNETLFQILSLLCLVTLTSAEDIKEHEPATSYSVIYRYDTPVTKIDSSLEDDITTEPKITEQSSVFNGKTPIVYELTKPVNEQKMETYNLPQNIEGQIESGIMNTQMNYNGLAFAYSDSTDTIAAAPTQATYPSINPAPIIQEGRLITPGLSAYGSDEMLQ